MIALLCNWQLLWDRLGFCLLERLAFLGLGPASMLAFVQYELVIWGPFVDYILRMFGVRILYLHMSRVLHRMDK